MPYFTHILSTCVCGGGLCVCVCGHYFQQIGHRPGTDTNPACGQLNRGNGIFNFPCPCSRLRVWSRELGSAVAFRVSTLILHTYVESYITYGTQFPHPT